MTSFLSLVEKLTGEIEREQRRKVELDAVFVSLVGELSARIERVDAIESRRAETEAVVRGALFKHRDLVMKIKRIDEQIAIEEKREAEEDARTVRLTEVERRIRDRGETNLSRLRKENERVLNSLNGVNQDNDSNNEANDEMILVRRELRGVEAELSAARETSLALHQQLEKTRETMRVTSESYEEGMQTLRRLTRRAAEARADAARLKSSRMMNGGGDGRRRLRELEAEITKERELIASFQYTY